MISTRFDTLYVALRNLLRDPAGGGVETAACLWTLAEKKVAINRAIEDAQEVVRVPAVDESIALVADTYLYHLPATLALPSDLHAVYLEVASSPWDEVRTGWRVEDPGSGQLHLRIEEVWEAGKKLRLIFDAIPQTLTADADTTPVPAAFLLARARAYLHAMRAEDGTGDDIAMSLKRSEFWWSRSNDLYGTIVLGANRVRAEGRLAGATW